MTATETPPRPTRRSRASERSLLFEPELRPYTRAAIFLNNELGPAIGHVGYRAFRRRGDRVQLGRNRERMPLAGLQANPLVSIRIATYNRSNVLMHRALPSALRQSYANIEVVVVGDHCTDDTESQIASVGDSRVRFVNLQARTQYPASRRFRWRAIGNGPWNAALERCKGQWIATLDDDDEFLPDHIEVLLREASARQLEMVYGKALREEAPGQWVEVGGDDPSWPEVHHSSVLYSARLGFLRYSSMSWLWLESADTNMWHRMRAIGASHGYVDRVITRSYGGGYSSSPAHWQPQRSAA